MLGCDAATKGSARKGANDLGELGGARLAEGRPRQESMAVPCGCSDKHGSGRNRGRRQKTTGAGPIPSELQDGKAVPSPSPNWRRGLGLAMFVLSDWPERTLLAGVDTPSAQEFRFVLLGPLLRWGKPASRMRFPQPMIDARIRVVIGMADRSLGVCPARFDRRNRLQPIVILPSPCS